MTPKQAHEKRVQEIREAYKNVPKSAYQTIESCVEYAMKHHSHLAFAHHFLDLGWLDENLFVEAFQTYIDEKEMYQKGWWYSCRLIKPGFFYDPNVTPELLRTDSKLFSGKSSLAQWKQGDNIPGRETIIQSGFYLDLDAEQVNDLLHRAGYEELYIINGAEAICWFYLNLFQKTNPKLTGFEKLCKVKEKINTYYKELNYEEKGLLRAWRGKKKKKKKEETKVYYTDLHNPMLLAYDQTLGWNIESEIRELQQKPCIQNMQQEIDPELTAYLTVCLTKELEKCEEEKDLEAFIKQGQDIFTIKGYGFLWKTWKYIKQMKQYQKNLYIPAVMPQSRVHGDISMFEKNRFFLNQACEQVYDCLEEGKIPTLEEATDALKSILRMRDLHGQNTVKVARKSFNLLDLLLTGRNIALMRYTEEKEKAGTSYRYIFEDETVKKAFLYDLGDRNNLIKFCLATGNEEELDHYLELAGFKTMSEAKEEGTQNKTDLLIEYLLAYKNALLKKWCQDITRKGTGVSEAQARMMLNRQFPLLKLLMLVNQDIVNVMEYYWDPTKATHRERVQKNEACLIYAVDPIVAGE